MCDKDNSSKYHKSTTVAGVEGFFQGLGGLFGLSGFWTPVNNDGLTQAKTDMDNLKTTYDALVQNDEDILNKKQKEFAKDQSDYIQLVQAFHDEIIQEQIQSNSLYIQIIGIIVIIIIIYLIVL